MGKIHGALGKITDLDAICQEPHRLGAGYTKDWDKVTCPGCRSAIDGAFDFIRMNDKGGGR